jgi:hypothetical protein
MRKLYIIFIAILFILPAYAQYLNIWNNIHWQEAVSNANMQSVFSEMNRQQVEDMALKNGRQPGAVKSATAFIKTKSTIIAKLAAQAGGNKQESEKLLQNCLEQFYSTMKTYRLRTDNLADGMALCAIMNYNTYGNRQGIDENGLKITIQQLEKTLLRNKSLLAQSNQQKQESMEQIAIGTIIAQMATGNNSEKAKTIATGIFKNILHIAVSDVSFGANGFFVINSQQEGLANAITVFKRTNSCLSCNDFAIKSSSNNNNEKFTSDHFKALIADFDNLLIQKGKKTNDIADMLTECFAMCYFIDKQEYQLNQQQIASARTIILQNLSDTYNEFKAKSDQQKQLLYEDYVVRTMQAQYMYKKGKKQREDLSKKVAQQNPNDAASNVYEAMGSVYGASPESYAKGDAGVLLVKMLKPLNLSDYILADDGFIKK